MEHRGEGAELGQQLGLLGLLCLRLCLCLHPHVVHLGPLREQLGT
jgi:hypothetical protein